MIKYFLKPSSLGANVKVELDLIGGKLYVKWKGYNNSFNIWIDQKGIA